MEDDSSGPDKVTEVVSSDGHHEDTDVASSDGGQSQVSRDVASSDGGQSQVSRDVGLAPCTIKLLFLRTVISTTEYR